MHSSLPFGVRHFCLLTALAVVLSGCGTGGATVLVPVMGGSEKVRVDLTSRGPAHVKADGFEVDYASFIPRRPPLHPDFSFTLLVKDTSPPRRITIEDITEETAQLFLTDESPAVSNGLWHRVVSDLDAHDPRIEWLHRMNNDIRIYRFTIIAADGHKVVLNQATSFPTSLKAGIREAFGIAP